MKKPLLQSARPPSTKPESCFATFEQLRGLTPAECDRVLSIAAGRRPTRATVARGRRGITTRYEVARGLRSATLVELPLDDETRWLFERVVQLAGRANDQRWQFELSGIFHPLKCIRYDEGDHYAWHTDLGAGVTSDRKLSITIQLTPSAGYAGGDLELIDAPQPKKTARTRGSMVVFPSYVLHRVAPVTRGTRQALVTWIQGPPLR